MSLKVMNSSLSMLLLMEDFVSFEKLNDIPLYVYLPLFHIFSSVSVYLGL